MKIFNLILLLTACFSCKPLQSNQALQQDSSSQHSTVSEISLIVLGTVQDGGSPHIGCKKDCCRDLFRNPDITRKVVSLGVIDPEYKQKYIFEATPDLPEQMKLLKEFEPEGTLEIPNGIFLTHAHIGHYTGLMYLGKEAMNTTELPVYAMPAMKNFLENNGPWSQLVSNHNIAIQPIYNNKPTTLSPKLSVIPFRVPHRDEFSETVGFTITGPNKKALFIPDIDKWEKWSKSIITEIAAVDYAFIDGTFYDAEEINYRDITAIPHPFIIESMALFKDIPAMEKSKVYFIHFNHTNPALQVNSEKAQQILNNGFGIARTNDVFPL